VNIKTIIKKYMTNANLSFKYSELSAENIKEIALKVNSVWQSPTIEGVFYKSLKIFLDGRGDLIELWSEPWLEEGKIEPVKHIYFNRTALGVTKAWHVHEKTISQYTCVEGKMQIVLVDARKDSPTFGNVDQFVIGTRNPAFIRIPPGVLKGWKALENESVIVNLLTLADTADNYKYPWETILQNIWEPKNG